MPKSRQPVPFLTERLLHLDQEPQDMTESSRGTLYVLTSAQHICRFCVDLLLLPQLV